MLFQAASLGPRVPIRVSVVATGSTPCGRSVRGYPSPAVPVPGIRGGTQAVPSQLFLFRVFGVVPKRCLPNCSFSGYPGGGTQAGARSAGTSPPQLQVGSSQYPTASVAPRRWVRGVSGGPFGSVRPEVIAFWVFRHFGQRLISARDPSCSAVSGLLLKLRSGT